MKKLLFISFFSILTLNTLFSQIFYDQDDDKNLYLNFKYKNDCSRELKYLLDSTVSYNYNTPNLEWVKSDKSFYTYENKGNISSTIFQKVNNNIYTNTYKYIYELNNDNLVVLFNKKNWNSNNLDWENYSIDSFYYKGKIDWKSISKDWNPSLLGYVNAYRYENEIDSNEKITSNTNYIWDGSVEKWVEFDYTKNNYNIDGNKIVSVYYEFDETTQKLNPFSKDTFGYDSQNRVIYNIYYNFNEVDSSYIPTFKYITKYSKNIDTTYTYTWYKNNSVWVNNLKSYYNYDSNGDLIRYTIQGFNSNNNWETISEYSYVLDGNRNRVESIRKNTVNGVLDFSRKVNYFYSQHEVISSVQSIDPKLKIYPNPTYSVLNLENLNGYEKATIYDINGKLLVQKVISNDVEKIDLSNLTNGIYFLRLVNKNTDIVTKIIKN